jgi:hypothetical protein
MNGGAVDPEWIFGAVGVWGPDDRRRVEYQLDECRRESSDTSGQV